MSCKKASVTSAGGKKSRVTGTRQRSRQTTRIEVMSSIRVRLYKSQSAFLCKLSWNVLSSGYGLTISCKFFFTKSVACFQKKSLDSMMHSAPRLTWRQKSSWVYDALFGRADSWPVCRDCILLKLDHCHHSHPNTLVVFIPFPVLMILCLSLKSWLVEE